VFRIDEGPKVRIWDISFQGNKFVSGPILKTKITSKTVFLGFIAFIGGDYDPELIRNDVLALKQYYMGLGFFDVDVQADEGFSEDKGKVSVTFTIEEGRRYQVGTVDIVTREQIISELTTDVHEFVRYLPGVSVNQQILSGFQRQGLGTILDARELRRCQTTWAKRLAYGREPRAVCLKGVRGSNSTSG
jgi:outer membrane protein assembly factor BamA